MPGYETGSSHGPGLRPRLAETLGQPVVERLNREIGRIMLTPEARAALASFAAEVVSASAGEFAAIQQRDRDRFGAFIRDTGIRLD